MDDLRDRYSHIVRGTWDAEASIHERENFDFSQGHGQYTLSKAITNILRRENANTKWMTKAQIYQSLRFNPMPTKEEFEAIFTTFSKRFDVYYEWVEDANGNWKTVEWFILADRRRDRELADQAALRRRQLQEQTLEELRVVEFPRPYEHFLDEIFNQQARNQAHQLPVHPHEPGQDQGPTN